jgi:hypothetical protein
MVIVAISLFVSAHRKPSAECNCSLRYISVGLLDLHEYQDMLGTAQSMPVICTILNTSLLPIDCDRGYVGST